MRFLCEICPKRRTYLVSPHDIAIALSKKFVLSISEIDEIMQKLSFENYIDFVASNSKNGYYYCITLKSKALTLKKDLKKQKKEFWFVLARTFGLAVLSFVVGIILKIIFKK